MTYLREKLIMVCLGILVANCTSLQLGSAKMLANCTDKAEWERRYKDWITVWERDLSPLNEQREKIYRFYEATNMDGLDTLKKGIESFNIENVEDVLEIIELIEISSVPIGAEESMLQQRNDMLRYAFQNILKIGMSHGHTLQEKASYLLKQELQTAIREEKERYRYYGPVGSEQGFFTSMEDKTMARIETAKEQDEEEIKELTKMFLQQLDLTMDRGRLSGLELLKVELEDYKDERGSFTLDKLKEDIQEVKQLRQNIVQQELRELKQYYQNYIENKKSRLQYSLMEEAQESIRILGKIKKEIYENSSRFYSSSLEWDDGSSAKMMVEVSNKGNVYLSVEAERGSEAAGYDNWYLSLSVPLMNEDGETVYTFTISSRYISKGGIDTIKISEAISKNLARQITGIGRINGSARMVDDARNSGTTCIVM